MFLHLAYITTTTILYNPHSNLFNLQPVNTVQSHNNYIFINKWQTNLAPADLQRSVVDHIVHHPLFNTSVKTTVLLLKEHITSCKKIIYSLQILSWLVDKTEMQDVKINIQLFWNYPEFGIPGLAKNCQLRLNRLELFLADNPHRLALFSCFWDFDHVFGVFNYGCSYFQLKKIFILGMLW